MDVMVTVPKGYDMGEKLASRLCYWRVNGTPRRTKKGEKIRFIHDGEITMEATIHAVRDGSIEFIDLGPTPEPRVKHKGFRGFRYEEA